MSEHDAVWRFFAYVLMAVGGLITVLCGGCTVLFLLIAAWTTLFAVVHPATAFSGGVSLGVLAIAIGGLPTVIGVALFLAGLKIKRPIEASRPPNADSPFS